MKVFKPGSVVQLAKGLEPIDAVVTAVLVGEGYVRYWVVYWNGGKLEEQIVDSCLVSAKMNTPTQSVGFKP